MLWRGKILAILLSGTVLIGSQCIELCAMLSCDRAEESIADGQQSAACQQRHCSKRSQRPAQAACAQREMVADTESGSAVPDRGQATPTLVRASASLLCDASTGSRVVLLREPAFSRHRPRTLSVLRI